MNEDLGTDFIGGAMNVINVNNRATNFLCIEQVQIIYQRRGIRCIKRF